MLSTAREANDLLEALAEQLAATGVGFDLVVIGGSALLALGLGQRPTRMSTSLRCWIGTASSTERVHFLTR